MTGGFVQDHAHGVRVGECGLVGALAAQSVVHIRHGYEPLFFDADLSFTDKIAQWRMKPTVSIELVSNMLMLALLAVGVASIR